MPKGRTTGITSTTAVKCTITPPRRGRISPAAANRTYGRDAMPSLPISRLVSPFFDTVSSSVFSLFATTKRLSSHVDRLTGCHAV